MEHQARAWEAAPALLVWTFLLFALLGPNRASCSAVERQMKLKDVSAKTSPISVSGYVTYRYDDSKQFPFSYQENILAKNVSGKSVLLMVMHLEANAGPRGDETYSQEYFFGNALEPGAVEVHDEPETTFRQEVNGTPLVDSGEDPHAAAKVRVEFVQFGDGSTWGDADSAKTALDMRSATLAELDALDHIYEQKGEAAFLEELARADDYPPAISQLRNACNGKAEKSSCAHDAIQRTIDTAKHHQTEMDLGLASRVSAPR
jgi:hypothetical protein